MSGTRIQGGMSEIFEMYQPHTLAQSELKNDGPYLVYGANGVIGKHTSYNHEEAQVLVTCRGATCGAINVSAPFSWINGNAMVIKPRENNVDLAFLKYYLESGIDIKKVITGAAQPQITRQSLSLLKVDLPPLAEQQRIAEILDKAELIKRNRELAIEKLDELAQSVFIEMFGDSVTNNKGWELKSLGEIADFYAGNSLPKESAYKNQSDGYFLMKVSDMNSLGNEREIKSCKSWSDLTGAKSATCPKGSIVIPKRGGAIGTNKKRITTRPTVLDPNLMAIKPKEDIVLTEYLFQWFLNFDLLSITNGSSVPQLNKKDLDPLRIQIPAIKTQEKFRNFIELHLAHKAKNINLMKGETMLIDSIKHQAFSGQL